MPNNCLFQLLRCGNLLLLSVLYQCKLNIFQFCGWLDKTRNEKVQPWALVNGVKHFSLLNIKYNYSLMYYYFSVFLCCIISKIHFYKILFLKRKLATFKSHFQPTHGANVN